MDQNNTQAALDFARKHTEAKILEVAFEGATEQVLITTGADGGARVTPIVDLYADRAAAPQRRKGTVIVHDLTSFIMAVNRDSDDSSVIFADVPGRKVTAILDFHFARGGPRWCQDRVEYGFTLSSQLTAWLNASVNRDGTPKLMNQKDFARLIDDRIGDVATAAPTPGSLADKFAKQRGIGFASITDLLVFTRTIVGKSSADASEMYDENTGASSLQYSRKNQVNTPDGQPVVVPLAFALSIPILCGLGATNYTIAVRLRYDINEGKGITWRTELNALDQYILAAIDEALEIVRRPAVAEAGAAPQALGCGLDVFMGAAPAPAA